MIGLNSPMNPAVTRAAVTVYMVQPLRGVKRAARPPLMPTMMAKARSSMDRDVELSLQSSASVDNENVLNDSFHAV